MESSANAAVVATTKTDENDKKSIEEDCQNDFNDNGNNDTAKKLKLNRLGKCEVCNAKDACYACPKCEVKTCCLACVNIHKVELDCNGIRDRTKYVPLKSMTEKDFWSDYYFLEECTRYVTDRQSDKIKQFSNDRNSKTKSKSSHTRLRAAAKHRGIILQFLVPHFERRKKNTTKYQKSQDKIYWHIEWLFYNANCLTFTDDNCDETLPLVDLLNKYINPKSHKYRNQLEYYQSAGDAKLKVFLKAEGVINSHKRFFPLNIYETLKQNLAAKTIVEFPTIYVGYEDLPEGFDVIDSDEDLETEKKETLSKFKPMQTTEMKSESDEDVNKREINDKPVSKAAATSSKKITENTANDSIEKGTYKKKKRGKGTNEMKNFFFDNDDDSDSSSSTSSVDKN